MARGVEIVLLSYLSSLGCIPSGPVDLEIFVFSFPVSSLFFSPFIFIDSIGGTLIFSTSGISVLLVNFFLF